MSNSRPAGLFRPATSFYVARESIWLSYKKKKKKLCYFISYIMKVRINTTSFCFYLPFYLYAEIDFGVHMIRDAYRIRCVGVFRWWRLRGRLKGIKRTSSSARAPPTEKHDILHSFNELKKTMEAFRHDFLLLFLWSYFNDKCPEHIIACKSASNARAQTSPLAGGFPFIHSHRKRTRSLSVRHYMCALKNDLLSWI